MDFAVGAWNVRGATHGDKQTTVLSDQKAAFILERIEVDDLDLVCLTEVWGNKRSLARFGARFEDAGFRCVVLQGQLSPDRSRRTGGLVAIYRRRTFAYVRWSDVGSTAAEPHMGNFADLVLTRRGREEPFHLLCFYGPHPTAEALTCLEACQAHIQSLTDPWVWVGDFNLVVRPDEALPARILGKKDELFAAMVGEADGRVVPPPGAAQVGSRLRLRQDPGSYTFRRGVSGSNIDHVVVPLGHFGFWESVRTLHPPPSARLDGSLVPLSDHAFVHVRRLRPAAVLIGEERLVRFDTKRAWSEEHSSSLRRVSAVSWGALRDGVAPHEELGRLCATVVDAARQVEQERKDRAPSQGRERPADDLKTQVKFWRGNNRTILRHWHNLGYLCNASSPIYRVRSLRSVLTNLWRSGAEAPYMLRDKLHQYASQRLSRAQDLYAKECLAVSRAGARGSDLYSPEAAAQMVNRQWADIRAVSRTPLARMRALDVLQPDGSRVRVSTGAEVLDAMRDHGVRQQGPSPAHVALSAAFVEAFVPQWPELRGSDGEAWDLRKELTFAEFRYTIGRMADKACGRDGMQLGFLLMLPTEMLEQFWGLLIECAALGTFPDAWSAVTAVLIPKKSGSSVRIEDQRDIWLQCIGPKTLMKMIVGNVYEPLRARILPCSAGAVAGRGCGELVWRMVLGIWQTHVLQTQVYMLWVDLSKCFMTFSRAVGQHTQARRGVPTQVRKAVWNLYNRPRGSFDSAFGCCADFGILRGYLQGTLEAPDLCIGDMNVLCEIMDLKVVGLRWFTGDVSGTHTVQTVFVDDGCAVNGSADMQLRAAFVWSLWAFIYGTDINVKDDASKTAVSGVQYLPVKGRRHLLRASPPHATHKVYLLDGRLCPDIHFLWFYVYLGQCISLSGSCEHTLEKLRGELARCIAAVRGRKADRRTQVAQANAYILGHCLQKGVALWVTFETADRILGPLPRAIFSSSKGGSARARAQGAPAWQVHAPLCLPSTANQGAPFKPRRLVHPVTGYGLWHPFAAAGAGAHLVFWAEMSSVLPERYLPAHSAYALAMYILGCRGEDPAQFDYSRHAASLNMEDPVEAALWRLWWAREGRCGWLWAGGAPPERSALAHGEGTVWAERRRSPPLWQGELWKAPRTTCRGLMRLGVDELAHVCTVSGEAYLTFGQAQDRWPVPGELREEWDCLIAELVAAGSPRASGFGHRSPREMHLGAAALFSAATHAPSAERDCSRAARTGSSLGTARHPSNLTITIGHLRDARTSWLTRRRAESAPVSRSLSRPDAALLAFVPSVALAATGLAAPASAARAAAALAVAAYAATARRAAALHADARDERRAVALSPDLATCAASAAAAGAARAAVVAAGGALDAAASAAADWQHAALRGGGAAWQVYLAWLGTRFAAAEVPAGLDRAQRVCGAVCKLGRCGECARRAERGVAASGLPAASEVAGVARCEGEGRDKRCCTCGVMAILGRWLHTPTRARTICLLHRARRGLPRVLQAAACGRASPVPPPSEDTARWAKHARDVVRAVGARLQEAVSTPGGREGVEVQGGGLAREALLADAGG